MYTKADWEKNTIIKDSVHGYINVPKPISKEIIDTDVFQRLKNIEQTGMQVLYPSATHNRFTHSLGVYHLSQKAFKHFKNNVQTDYTDIYQCLDTKFPAEDESLIHGYEGTWRRWELMFQLASLLHDCGHSPFSHTLEFVYDLADEPKTLSQELMDECSEQFKRDFIAQAEQAYRDTVGKPHERMSALFIAKTEDIEKGSDSEVVGGFKTRIKKLIESYMEVYGISNVYKKNVNIFHDDIEFMVRMIIGCHYELDHSDDYEAKNFHMNEKADREWKVELQLRNCVISMLNSKLDVDNLDYVVRDSKYSGYASNGIDLERLLSSFTIINAYQFDSPIHLTKENFFDASINLNSFQGTCIDSKVSGECMISSNAENLRVRGNIVTDTEDLSPKSERKIFRTREEFSATVSLSTDGTIAISPKTLGQKAYLNISGNLEGDLVGTILGDTCPYVKTASGVKHRIFFAYKQNCMSVLMSAIDGSNFENKWVYAHHTTTFKNNYLTVYLLERYAEYLVDCEVESFLETMNRFLDSNNPIECVESSRECGSEELYEEITGFLESCYPDEDPGYSSIRTCVANRQLGDDAQAVYRMLQLFQILKRLQDRKSINRKMLDAVIIKVRNVLVEYNENRKFYDRMACNQLCDQIYSDYGSLGALEIQCFSQIMPMFKQNNIQGHYFYRTDDQDLLAEYKKLYHQLLDSPEKQEKYKEFMIAYHHLITRTSMQCLWKSYPEFNFYFSDWTKEERKEIERLLHRASTPWGKSHGEKQLNYGILSDYVQLPENTERFWKVLKEKYKLTRLVYVEQSIRTKSFLRHETYIKNHERVVRLEDIRLYPNYQNNVDFFYIFYECGENGNSFTPGNFLQEVRKYISTKEDEEFQIEQKEVNSMDENGNLIIRDNIHGDIIFPPLFRAIIDTKEFQRLRRIKQLATAGQVFPGAVHTRFSHSIGTYHVMSKILCHFKEYFRNLNYDTHIDETEEKAILAAALLHDLGHGPYSHAFEQTNLSLGSKKHEKWTTSIIKDPHTEIHALLECVEEGFSEKVASYIECEKEVKNSECWEMKQLDAELNLKFIFASLVSGQIDADRMDYLLRDSKFSGVTYGQFDLEKVIEGLAVSVEHTGRYRVCVKEEYLDTIEEYFYARYQMHNSIYFHPYKLLSEELFRRILREAQKAVLNGQISTNAIPVAVERIFTKAQITNEEYCNLDDSVIDGATQIWAESGVKELAFLCQARLNRKFYKRLEIFDYEHFIEDAKSIFGEDVFEMHFLICQKKKLSMYASQNPVYILKRNGVIVTLDKCSTLAKEVTEKIFVYYSRDMAQRIYAIPESQLAAFERKLKKNHVCSNLEIEKKYVFLEEQINVVKEYFRKFEDCDEYEVIHDGEQLQIDTYYDTQDFMLKRNDYTLRIREKGGEVLLTCKCPVQSESNGIGGQIERVEYEEIISSTNLEDNREIVDKFLSGNPALLNIFDELAASVKINNRREKILLGRSNEKNIKLLEKYEIAVDNVEYINLKNQKKYKECQLEIELKSSYQNRINMKQLTDEMERKLNCLNAISDSKYKRALNFTTDEKVMD